LIGERAETIVSQAKMRAQLALFRAEKRQKTRFFRVICDELGRDSRNFRP